MSYRVGIKWTAVLLALALAVVLMAGCSKGDGGGSSAKGANWPKDTDLSKLALTEKEADLGMKVAGIEERGPDQILSDMTDMGDLSLGNGVPQPITAYLDKMKTTLQSWKPVKSYAVEFEGTGKNGESRAAATLMLFEDANGGKAAAQQFPDLITGFFNTVFPELKKALKQQFQEQGGAIAQAIDVDKIFDMIKVGKVDVSKEGLSPETFAFEFRMPQLGDSEAQRSLILGTLHRNILATVTVDYTGKAADESSTKGAEQVARAAYKKLQEKAP
ncbi:MAG: hypothetical protein HY677_05560 [Chloroflexi bacterium]|nr:hypothetical protein [Chloroflexota bacterium]